MFRPEEHHEGALDVGVDIHHRVDHVVLGRELGLGQALVGDLQEVAPRMGSSWMPPPRSGGDGLVVQDHEVPAR